MAIHIDEKINIRAQLNSDCFVFIQKIRYFYAANLALTSDLVSNSNYLFTMGSLEHAKTEILNFSTWRWKKSLPYLNFTEIYSFAVFFYQDAFYVVGGKTNNEILSEVSTFNPMTKKWTGIGNLKFSRFDHSIAVINDKLYVIGGSETFEYCDLLNNFGCSLVTDARFEQKDYPTLYGFYPSKCELGILYPCIKKYAINVKFQSVKRDGYRSWLVTKSFVSKNSVLYS